MQLFFMCNAIIICIIYFKQVDSEEEEEDKEDSPAPTDSVSYPQQFCQIHIPGIKPDVHT